MQSRKMPCFRSEKCKVLPIKVNVPSVTVFGWSFIDSANCCNVWESVLSDSSGTAYFGLDAGGVSLGGLSLVGFDVSMTGAAAGSPSFLGSCSF
jgi:hypothetical protein